MSAASIKVMVCSFEHKQISAYNLLDEKAIA